MFPKKQLHKNKKMGEGLQNIVNVPAPSRQTCARVHDTPARIHHARPRHRCACWQNPHEGTCSHICDSQSKRCVRVRMCVRVCDSVTVSMCVCVCESAYVFVCKKWSRTSRPQSPPYSGPPGDKVRGNKHASMGWSCNQLQARTCNYCRYKHVQSVQLDLRCDAMLLSSSATTIQRANLNGQQRLITLRPRLCRSGHHLVPQRRHGWTARET